LKEMAIKGSVAKAGIIIAFMVTVVILGIAVFGIYAEIRGYSSAILETYPTLFTALTMNSRYFFANMRAVEVRRGR